jgi:excisionase family DNA binding protein
MSPLLETDEVARLLRVSRRTVERLVASGELTALRIRGRVLYTAEDVNEFVQSQRNRS